MPVSLSTFYNLRKKTPTIKSQMHFSVDEKPWSPAPGGQECCYFKPTKREVLY